MLRELFNKIDNSPRGSVETVFFALIVIVLFSLLSQQKGDNNLVRIENNHVIDEPLIVHWSAEEGL